MRFSRAKRLGSDDLGTLKRKAKSFRTDKAFFQNFIIVNLAISAWLLEEKTKVQNIFFEFRAETPRRYLWQPAGSPKWEIEEVQCDVMDLKILFHICAVGPY